LNKERDGLGVYPEPFGCSQDRLRRRASIFSKKKRIYAEFILRTVEGIPNAKLTLKEPLFHLVIIHRNLD